MQGSKKFICPNCKHRTFKPYVLNDGTNSVIIDASLYGYCDRKNNCGYHVYPKGKHTAKDFVPVQPAKVEPDYIPIQIVNDTVKCFERQTLYTYLLTKFDKVALDEAFKKYKVGTCRNGGTIFWQIDIEGRAHTGKMMQYLHNGHRNKLDFGTWAHKASLIKKELHKDTYTLQQCLFGEHLIKDGCKVAIVESEKTAVCMSIIKPEYIWLATGGCCNVQGYKFRHLIEKHCDITFFPDKGMVKEWANKAGNIGNFDFFVEKEDSLLQGDDIWDYYDNLKDGCKYGL